jgi:hypothetical protein
MKPSFSRRPLLLVLLAGGIILNGCGQDQPLSPLRGPGHPSATLNPACGRVQGQTYTDSVTSAVTWPRAGSPHWVAAPIHIEGAGVLTIEAGARICFATAASLEAANGGRRVANGLDTARILLTALDADSGWGGVHLRGSPASASSLKNAVIEYTRGAYALSTLDYHAATVDSATLRQNERGVYLWGRNSRLSRSRVDTVTSSAYPAVSLGSVVTFEQNAVRGAAGVGVAVLGSNGIALLGGRIEGSGGTGLKVTTTGAGFSSTQPVRVVGGAGYPAELVVSAFPRIYASVAQQDSLLGNARDTVVITGGILQQWAYPAPALPWRVTGNITVQYYGILIPMPGAVLAFDPNIWLKADLGGRIVARGTAAAPVRFTHATSAYWGESSWTASHRPAAT